MAFALDSSSISRMASLVGTMTNSTRRRFASRFTSSMTGKRPFAPVPITSRRHFHGIFSSRDKGVCPNSSRNLFDRDFLRLRISPRSITKSCSYVLPSIPMEPNENPSKCIRASVPLRSSALLRGDGGEGRPALLNLATAAVRARSLFGVMLCDGLSRQECFLAGVADELIMGHTVPPQPRNGLCLHSSPAKKQLQSSPVRPLEK